MDVLGPLELLVLGGGCALLLVAAVVVLLVVLLASRGGKPFDRIQRDYHKLSPKEKEDLLDFIRGDLARD